MTELQRKKSVFVAGELKLATDPTADAVPVIVARSRRRRLLMPLLVGASALSSGVVAVAYADGARGPDRRVDAVLNSTVILDSHGAPGPNGQPAGPFDWGKPGDAGGSAGVVSAVMRGGRIATTTDVVGILLRSHGGAGGSGSNAGSLSIDAPAGGGGKGGDTNDLKLTIQSGSVIESASRSGAVQLLSTGGAGGWTGDYGDRKPQSGNGGNAATGNVLSIAGSVFNTASGAAVLVDLHAGVGGNQHGSNKAVTANIGGNAGNGGRGGRLAADISGSIRAASGNGVDIRESGGDGGTAGGAQNGVTSAVALGAFGIPGGHGGSSGNGTSTLKISGEVHATGATATGVRFIGSGGHGGFGGGAGSPSEARGGNGGNGGDTNERILELAAGGKVTGGIVGIEVINAGGGGGTANTGGAGVVGRGGDGGSGGASGRAVADISGSVAAAEMGVVVRGYGGAGGRGGVGGAGIVANSGRGGNGGDAKGDVHMTLNSTGSVATTRTRNAHDPNLKTVLPAIWVQSSGGQGAPSSAGGALIGLPGGGGRGGNAGYAGAYVYGNVSTKGAFAPGVLVQSAGGTGDGGNGTFGIFYSEGGAGGQGGDGGRVLVYGEQSEPMTRAITTEGANSSAIVAQSIGGGGGVGGNASGVGPIQIGRGGAGAGGGNGGSVHIGSPNTGMQTALRRTLVTRGNDSDGILAQSIGGGGGSGGNVWGGGSALSLGIGGAGSSGGNGGAVDIRTAGLITTFGSKSTAITAQSIGGGGGNGGAALAFSVGVISTAVTVGGSGGNGGTSGSVNVLNQHQITTYGADAPGILAQAIGGGGGNGGAATSTAIAISPHKDVPAISVGVAVGGQGGAGGDQSRSPVTVTNEGLITTAGSQSAGILAQNIAGGGGSGGDASAWSFSGGLSTTNISVSVAVGGQGGTGGTGGAVNARNSGLVMTLGESSYGVFGQSVGGGGGKGGAGDASSGADKGKSFSLGGSVSVGGNGGAASRGGAVNLDNSGGIVTNGDGAHALYGQSVGGGGGVAGGGVGKANGGNLAVNIAVGGTGGSGGMGGDVKVVNTGSLHTTGADADAIFAQSVGGGGGKGGKGATTTGGAMDNAKAAKSLLDRMKDKFGVDEGVTDALKGVVDVGESIYKQYNKKDKAADASKNKDGTTTEKKDKDAAGKALEIDLSVSVGGKGGAGGSGGKVEATNASSIVTTGARSDGMFLQSVGGGGGAGGAATVSDTSKTKIQLNVGAGGGGGGGGHGGEVVAKVNPGAEIFTAGNASNGLVVQSIGGGGGKGGVSAASATLPEKEKEVSKSLSIAVGGTGGASGNGRTVLVEHSGRIETLGKNAIGIIGQSIGGGGGIAQVLSSDETEKPAEKDKKEKDAADRFTLNLAFGGAGGSGGNADLVNLRLYGGSVETAGRNAYGILAQSIGGGGGAAIGGQVGNKAIFGVEGSGGVGGNGGLSSVYMENSFVATSGDGATGVWVQSIGGGGGIGGDTAADHKYLAIAGQKGQAGHGGDAYVHLLKGTSVITTGARADAIFAQSIGGGGGKISTVNGAYVGTAGGNGKGGNVWVRVGLDGSEARVSATGSGSAAIRAQSDGTTKGVVYVGVGKNAVVQGSHDTKAIIIDGGPGSKVEILGKVIGLGGNTSLVPTGIRSFSEGEDAPGVLAENEDDIPLIAYTGLDGEGPGAISAPGGADYHVAGSSTGNIAIGPGTVSVDSDGTLLQVDYIHAGTVDNAGTLFIGEDGGAAQTTVVNASLRNTGAIVVDADFVAGEADRLIVNGDADIDGRIVVNAKSLQSKRMLEVVSASSLDASDVRSRDGTELVFSYAGRQEGNSLRIEAQADFTPEGVPLDNGGSDTAAYLQQLWDEGSDPGLSDAFGQLSSVGREAYAGTLSGLSGQFLNAGGLARNIASMQFVDTMISCPVSLGSPAIPVEGDCVWGRVTGGKSTLDSSRSTIGFNHSFLTLQAGGQRDIGNGWIVGGSIGYENSHFDADGRQDKKRGDSVHAGLLVKRQIGNWQLTGALSGSYGWYDSTRYFSVGSHKYVASASPEALTVGLHSRIAYQAPFDSWYLKPYVDLHAIYSHAGSYRETGGGSFGLAVGSENNFQFAISPMVEFGGKVKLGETAFAKPFVSVGGEFHVNNDWGADASFLGASYSPIQFKSESKFPDAMVKLNAGIEFSTSENIQFKLEYTGRAGDKFQSHKGGFKFRYLFN